MPTTINKTVHNHEQALKVLQAYTSQPVKITIDDQMRASEIIKLQQYLVTQSKFSAGNVNKYIDDQMLGAKIIELQNAAG